GLRGGELDSSIQPRASEDGPCFRARTERTESTTDLAKDIGGLAGASLSQQPPAALQLPAALDRQRSANLGNAAFEHRPLNPGGIDECSVWRQTRLPTHWQAERNLVAHVGSPGAHGHAVVSSRRAEIAALFFDASRIRQR